MQGPIGPYKHVRPSGCSQNEVLDMLVYNMHRLVSSRKQLKQSISTAMVPQRLADQEEGNMSRNCKECNCMGSDP